MFLELLSDNQPLEREDDTVTKLKSNSKSTVTTESYYANFTRYILSNNSSSNSVDSTYSHKDWLLDPNSILSLNLSQLKSILKNQGLHVSGKKQELIQRLTKHYKRIDHAITIQRLFRGFLVRESERMRGPGYPNTNACLNITDFHSMDELCRIPREEFFSYADDNGFVYGFNIFSLMDMFKRNRKIINPYNREDVPISIVCNIFSLYKKILLLYPLTCNLTRFNQNESREIEQTILSDSRRREDTAEQSSYASDSSSDEMSSVTMESALYNAEEEATDKHLIESSREISDRMMYLQSTYSVDERIRMVFERISILLRRTANPQWFACLSKNEYNRFYNCYYVWWSRPNMHIYAEERNRGNPLDNPFSQMELLSENAYESFIRAYCTELIERMVYCGVNEYWQRIGATQAVTILTVVNIPARKAFQDFFANFS